jgi:hypothetical protein
VLEEARNGVCKIPAAVPLFSGKRRFMEAGYNVAGIDVRKKMLAVV